MIDFVCDDVLNWAKNYKGDKFHALLSDYPAGIFFMGREWDSDHGGRDKWISVMTEITSAMVEHLHPGAHCIVWALPRVSHWTATALENAGLEVRDVVTHVFGSGFPKSENVGKRLDKKSGMQREIIGVNPYYCEGRTADPGEYRQGGKNGSKHITAPATDAARTWQHHGSALKPANEHWIIARKPLIGTIAENCLQTGAGSLNIDAGRIGSEPAFIDRPRGPKSELINQLDGRGTLSSGGNGRWPANFVLSHSADCEYVGVKRVKGGNDPRGKNGQIYQAGQFQDNGGFKNGYESNHSGYADADGYETVQEWRCSESCPVRLLGEQSGELKSGAKTRNKVDPIPTGGKYGIYGDWEALCDGASFQGDTGTAARFFFNADFSLDQQEAIDNAAPFFYAAKSSSSERSAGLENMVQLRKDLTDDERAYVMAELAKVGLIV